MKHRTALDTLRLLLFLLTFAFRTIACGTEYNKSLSDPRDRINPPKVEQSSVGVVYDLAVRLLDRLIENHDEDIDNGNSR